MSTGYKSNYPSSGYASETQLRNEFQKIEEALEDTISRTGEGLLNGQSNSMERDLDLNGNDLLGVKEISVKSLLVDGVDYVEASEQQIAQIEELLETAEEAAEASQLSAEEAGKHLSEFRNRYYGAFPAAPISRPDFSPLQEGDLYFNTTTDELMVRAISQLGLGYWEHAGKGPQGPKGEQGEQGKPGNTGPQGPQGPAPIIVPAPGTFGFNIDNDGDLIVTYTDGSTPPDFSINQDGDLVLALD